MAISRARKEELVAQYEHALADADGFVITHYRALSVAKMEDLRQKMYDNSGEFLITKNTLFKIALSNTGWPVPEDLLKGPVGVAFAKGNFPGLSKSVLEFAKDHEERFEVIGGVMGENIIDPAGVEAISKLPTLEELHAQIAGLVVQPARQLLGVLYAADAQIVNVLQSHIKENLGGGDEAGDGEAA